MTQINFDSNDHVLTGDYRITVRDGHIVRIIHFVSGDFPQYHVKELDLSLGYCGPLDEFDKYGKKLYYATSQQSELCRLKEDSDHDFFNICIDAIKSLASFSTAEVQKLNSLLTEDEPYKAYCSIFM